MFHQTALVGEDLSAVLTAEGFLPRVDLHVCLQVGRLVEGFAALHTAVGFLARVHVDVFLQVALIREEFSTVQAAEGLFSSVQSVVFLQTGGLTETFPTQGAVVGFLARVHTLVQDQGAGVGEMLPTVFTHRKPVWFKWVGVGLRDESLVGVREVSFRKGRVTNRADLGAVRTYAVSVHEIIIDGRSCTHVRSRVLDVVWGGVEYSAFP